MSNFAYEIFITDQDMLAIRFSGHRYGWSDGLRHLAAGENKMTEGEAWEWKTQVDEDAEGGHQMFPLLDPDSGLYSKLINLYNQIV